MTEKPTALEISTAFTIAALFASRTLSEQYIKDGIACNLT